MGIQLKKGRNFSKEFGTDQNSAIIVNEAFVQYFHWDSGLGKNLPSNRFPKHQIIGVVKDFHFEDLKNEIAPLAIVLDPTVLFQGISDIDTTYSPRNLNFINIRTRGSDFHLVLSLLENTWKKVGPGHPFQFSFLDQDIQQQYQDIERWETIVGTAAVFTILIACLGLYGLAALTVSRRKKEIGVRKVLGASTSNIVVILSRDFGKLVLTANIVAWPVAYIIMHGWLKAFAFRIRPGMDNFVMAAVLALFIALLAVSYQSIKAALSDPVETIRCE
jgi:putative ABC transport system permease protein